MELAECYEYSEIASLLGHISTIAKIFEYKTFIMFFDPINHDKKVNI